MIEYAVALTLGACDRLENCDHPDWDALYDLFGEAASTWLAIRRHAQVPKDQARRLIEAIWEAQDLCNR